MDNMDADQIVSKLNAMGVKHVTAAGVSPVTAENLGDVVLSLVDAARTGRKLRSALDGVRAMLEAI